MQFGNEPLPDRFRDLKQEIASSVPDFEARVTAAWNDLLHELKTETKNIEDGGSDAIPQVEFSELKNLSAEKLAHIKRIGSMVIRNVVDDDEAVGWKNDLKEYVKANPDVEGMPEGNKQFFQLYWTPSQVKARAHPNVLAVSAFLNKTYHVPAEGIAMEGVDLTTPLTYADRFRIRQPGVSWSFHPPHVDGGAIERWEDPSYRSVFAAILNGDWRAHDPYAIENRLKARSSLYGRPNQSTVFRTFQGWLAMSETAPTEGTLKVFPRLLLSNAYIILRPFFSQINPDAADPLAPENWKFDISTPDFPGIHRRDGGFGGPRLSPALHPHLDLEKCMISVPKVYPGDMVFWHGDVVHSVEQEHKGSGDSAVMYIPAVPATPLNSEYVKRQAENFLKGRPPPDFPQGRGEADDVGRSTPELIVDPIGKRAMGLPIQVA